MVASIAPPSLTAGEIVSLSRKLNALKERIENAQGQKKLSQRDAEEILRQLNAIVDSYS